MSLFQPQTEQLDLSW